MNDENIRPYRFGNSHDTATIQREREIQAMGGKASGESTRERKRLRALLEQALDGTIAHKDGGELSRREVTAIELADKMATGALKAIEIGAKLLGEFRPDAEVEIHTEQKFIGFSSVLPSMPNIKEICAKIDAERERHRNEE